MNQGSSTKIEYLTWANLLSVFILPLVLAMPAPHTQLQEIGPSKTGGVGGCWTEVLLSDKRHDHGV